MQIAGCAQMLGPWKKVTVNLVQCQLETMLEWYKFFIPVIKICF